MPARSQVMCGLLLASLSWTAAGQEAGRSAGEESCSIAFKTFNITDRFAGVVAHGIHDISVEDLREFHSDVPCQNNGVPTVNRDLRAEQGVLLDAPCVHKGKSPFVAGSSMHLVDMVLSKMDDTKYDVGRYSGMERLVHAFHMRHVWSMAGAEYKKLEVAPPQSQICACALDIDENGVMKMLRFLALQIREPDLMYGWRTMVDGKRMSWDSNLYDYAFFPKDRAESDVLSRKASRVPRLRTSQDWAAWKSLMARMLPSDHRDLAVFLYCALHRPV